MKMYLIIISNATLTTIICERQQISHLYPIPPQEEYYGKQLILADRDMVEQGADEILKDADVTDVAFLVVGDPFG